MRSKEDGSPVRPATVNTYVASVKSSLGFAHRVGFTRFNAAPLIKLKKAPRQSRRSRWLPPVSEANPLQARLRPLVASQM